MDTTTNCVFTVFVYCLQSGEGRTGFEREEETFARKNEDDKLSFHHDLLCHGRGPPSCTLHSALYGDYQPSVGFRRSGKKCRCESQ